MSDATVVLVHGAWCGAWIFEKLMAALHARGVASVAMDLPTCTNMDASADVHTDAEAVRSVLATIDGPVVLVGSSYGGVVITAAWCRSAERQATRLRRRRHAEGG